MQKTLQKAERTSTFVRVCEKAAHYVAQRDNLAQKQGEDAVMLVYKLWDKRDYEPLDRCKFRVRLKSPKCAQRFEADTIFAYEDGTCLATISLGSFLRNYTYDKLSMPPLKFLRKYLDLVGPEAE